LKEGIRKKEEGRRKKEEGRRKKEEILVSRFYLETHFSLAVPRHF
jgi:hypothetical protein